MTKQQRKERRLQRATEEAEREARLEAARRVVDSGICPKCGAKLKSNNSMSGWWQCEQFGSTQFRKDPTKRECTFQTFVV